MKRLNVLFLGALILMAPLSAFAQLTILINKQPYEFPRPVRLSSVLSVVADSGDWYWPAAGVFNLNDATAEREKEAILSELRKLLAQYEEGSNRHDALSGLYTQVASWTVATRVEMPVSYTRARLYPEENPMFQPGKYLLRLSGRPDVIHFSGVVEKPGAYRHSSGAVYTIANSVKHSAGADNSTVYVIDLMGNVHLKGAAYWNVDYAQIMPGSQIFVPIAGNFIGNTMDTLNQRIAHLAVHRILVQ
jgi:Capsule biosynthesis GfcC C-terminal/Capsule biosynthesis GfcC, N-terminal